MKKEIKNMKDIKDINDVDQSENGVLALLWRLIVFENSFQNVVKSFLDAYGRKGKRSKTTINGYFTAKAMTWKTFMFLVFKILPVKKMIITIKLVKYNNSESVHTLEVTPACVMDEDDAIELTNILEKELKNKNKENKDGV